MFEQSILADPPKTRKRSVLFASFLAQIAICGVLLLIPLVYTDAITFVPEWEPSLVIEVAPPPPPPEREAVRTATATPSRAPRRIFIESQQLIAPVSIPPEAVILSDAGMSTNDGPAVDTIVGIPIAAISNDLPRVLVPPPAERVVEPSKPEPVPAVPVRISGTLQAAKLIGKILPVYPAIAKQVRAQGTVRIHAIIGRDGRVRELQVTDGHPLLRQAAADAVRQWVYSPTILGNQAVEVDTIIEVNFVLN